MIFKPNDIVLAKYDFYPPWPSKIAPLEISEELLNRSDKEGVVVMFYGDELTYGIIENEEDISLLNTEIVPENDDPEWIKAFELAKENKTDFPALDPPSKKELKMIERRKKRSKKELLEKKEEEKEEKIKPIEEKKEENKPIGEKKEESQIEIKEEENKPIEIKEEKKEINNFNIQPEEIKENEEIKEEEIKENKMTDSFNYQSVKLNHSFGDDSLEKEVKRFKRDDSDKHTISFDDELIKKSLNSEIPGLSFKEESIYKKCKKNSSLFLKAFLKKANKRKYLKIKKELSKILLRYPNDTLRTNKIINKLEKMSKERILRNGLFTPLVNLYLNDWLNDPLEVKLRCEKLIKKIVE